MINLEEVINKAVEKSVKEAILAAHPVGSYYFSDDDTNPSLILGGVDAHKGCLSLGKKH